MRDCKRRPSSPHRSPNATPAWVIEQIESWRRELKWSARRITDELVSIGFVIDRRTVSRHLTRLGLGKRRFIDPGGENNRKPGKITARWPGHMVHLDVKKVGRIPDGGGWRIHGRDSDQVKVAPRHNGKVERYQRIMAEEVLYTREFTSEDARSAAIAVWNIHYNCHRPHVLPPESRQQHASARASPTSSPHPTKSCMHLQLSRVRIAHPCRQASQEV